MSVLFEGGECLLVLGNIADLLEFILLLRVLLLKELLFKCLDVLLHLFQHSPDLKLVIGEVVNEDSVIVCPALGLGSKRHLLIVVLLLFIVLVFLFHLELSSLFLI